MIKLLPLNVDKDHTAPTVLAGYFKFGSRTLLLGNYGTTGGGESVLNMIKINYHIPLVGGGTIASDGCLQPRAALAP